MSDDVHEDCPFCGGTLDTILVASQVVAVECLGCGVQMRTRTGGAEIVEAVNRRTVPREVVLAAMAAAVGGGGMSESWIAARMGELLGGTAEAMIGAAPGRDARAVAVAHALGFPCAKVPT